MEQHDYISSFNLLYASNSGSSPGMPIHQSTPTRKSRPTVKGRPHLNIVNVNCQSASAKRLSLERLISHQRPDIVIGTESWLHAGIENKTIFPTDVYQVFRRDREKGNTMGGVFIFAEEELTITREELETDSELLWCRVEMQGSKSLHIAAYYRPNEKDEHSLDELEKSLH